MWRSGGRPNISVAAPFVWRCLSGSTLAPFPHPAHRTGSNYVAPQATLDALVPAFNYFAAWYLLAVVGFLFIGIETRGQTIEELDAALAGRCPFKAAAPRAGSRRVG